LTELCQHCEMLVSEVLKSRHFIDIATRVFATDFLVSPRWIVRGTMWTPRCLTATSDVAVRTRN
jgi:hypothetical protein